MPRTRRFIPLLLFCALAPGLIACGQQPPAAPTVVLVVRHAEKATDQGDDPDLTEAGKARALSLIKVAEEAGVTAVYSSQFKRTMKTAEPLAAHLGLPVTTVELTSANLATYPALLAERVLAEHRGETVLIVNHSNTAPAIVAALGGAAVPDITEDEYDHLFVVVIPADGPARTIQAQYGR